MWPFKVAFTLLREECRRQTNPAITAAPTMRKDNFRGIQFKSTIETLGRRHLESSHARA
jgi:hypothetical protein